MIPSLLQMIYVPLNQTNDTTIKTYEQEDAEMAFKLINVFMTKFPMQMNAYVQELYELVKLFSEKIKN